MRYLFRLLLVSACAAAAAADSFADDEPTDEIVDRATDSLFSMQAIDLPDGQGGVVAKKYRLFIPAGGADDDEGGRTWPLLVWLHGWGESGDDNRAHIRWLELLFRREKDARQFPCFVMAYQCPFEHRNWYSGRAAEEPLAVAKAILDELLQNYPIDRQRIYVSGVSSGGTACWEMLRRHPQVFAAAVPLASGGGPSAELGGLVDIPIWAFHTREDPGTSVVDVRRTVKQLQDLGGKVYLTETPGYTHDCWNVAFSEFRFVDWLLVQRKGIAAPPPPVQNRSVEWRLFWQSFAANGPQYFLPLPLIAIALFWLARRARRRHASRPALPASR